MSDLRVAGDDRDAPVVLAFDTAASACSVAVGRGKAVLGHERREMRHGHAEALLPMIDRVVAAADLAPGGISVVAVTVGPGGFTGIRAGLAAAQGLALAARAELVGVSSFAAVAARVPANEQPLLVALDSRREELYVQLFAPEGAPRGDPAAVLPEDLTAWLSTTWLGNGAICVAGDAAVVATAALPDCNVTVVADSAPNALGVLAAARRDVYVTAALPLYLRSPDVSFPKPRPAPGKRA